MTSQQAVTEQMSLEEIRVVAETKVKQEVWDWINGGTETESTLQRNRSALEKIMLRLRVLHGLQSANTSAKILGQTVKTPVMVAPFANMGRIHQEAELAIARGAEEAGAIMFLGSVSTHSAEEIVRAVNTPVVWIGEPLKDRQRLSRQMHQAEKAGCCAVGLCLDDFMGIKIRDRLIALPNASLSAGEISKMRKETSLPFVLKGIMTLEDALAALDAGANAIVVSNHGGRVLDCCQASVDVLPEIVAAVNGKIEVLVDGGFRRGTDVLKALALGATGVLIGRPVCCWGLAAAGAEGVARVLRIVAGESTRAMILTNVPDASAVSRDCVAIT